MCELSKKRSANQVLADVEQFLEDIHKQRNFMTEYSKVHSKLRSHLLGKTGGNMLLTEDIISQVFIKAFNRYHSYSAAFAFSTWIFTIANNQLTDYWRKNKTELFTATQESTLATSDFLPKKNVESVLQLQYIEHHLDKLPDIQSQAIRMRYIDQVDIATIAIKLQKTNAATRKLLSRGIQALRSFLEPPA